MTFEEELAAAVYVDCICLFCGTHLPVAAESDAAECCEDKRVWLEQQRKRLHEAH